MTQYIIKILFHDILLQKAGSAGWVCFCILSRLALHNCLHTAVQHVCTGQISGIMFLVMGPLKNDKDIFV